MSYIIVKLLTHSKVLSVDLLFFQITNFKASQKCLSHFKLCNNIKYFWLTGKIHFLQVENVLCSRLDVNHFPKQARTSLPSLTPYPPTSVLWSSHPHYVVVERLTPFLPINPLADLYLFIEAFDFLLKYLVEFYFK